VGVGWGGRGWGCKSTQMNVQMQDLNFHFLYMNITSKLFQQNVLEYSPILS
jgi:hypothetical protein